MNEEQRAADTRELMIRLDERMKAIQTSVNEVKTLISSKVENDQEYKEMVAKVDKMWDLKNRAMGYIAAWSFGISIGTGLVIAFLKDFFFHR